MSDSSHGMSPADGVRYTRGVSAAMDSVRPAGGGKPGKRVTPQRAPGGGAGPPRGAARSGATVGAEKQTSAPHPSRCDPRRALDPPVGDRESLRSAVDLRGHKNQAGEVDMFRSMVASVACAFVGLSVFAPNACAQGKEGQLTVLVGTAPGGSFDLVGRVVSRTLVKYLPGNPTPVPQNMPGAGSMIAANYLFTVAPQDGSVVGVINPALAFNQVFGNANVRFDVAKFNWIGSPVDSLIAIPIWHTSPIRTWQDATRTAAIVGAPVQTSPDAMSFYLMNSVLGTRFNVVTGYKGGKDLDLAMERGEIVGRGGQSWSGLKAIHPDWIRDRKIVPILQIGLQAADDLAGVPLLSDLVSDPEKRKVVELYSVATAVGRPLVMGPGVPAARVATMRAAFLKTMKDADFIAEARKSGLDVAPIAGEAIQREMAKFEGLSPKLVAFTKRLVGAPK
jgi:tripartite-type tricarboxylate transporter receptor subunit TctC